MRKATCSSFIRRNASKQRTENYSVSENNTDNCNQRRLRGEACTQKVVSLNPSMARTSLKERAKNKTRVRFDSFTLRLRRKYDHDEHDERLPDQKKMTIIITQLSVYRAASRLRALTIGLSRTDKSDRFTLRFKQLQDDSKLSTRTFRTLRTLRLNVQNFSYDFICTTSNRITDIRTTPSRNRLYDSGNDIIII